MTSAAALQAEVARADAEVRHHKRKARCHRISAREAAERRERLKEQLAKMGIGFSQAD